MPDWRHGIRQNLRLDNLDPGRQIDIVEDLAQQLEDAYRDALGRGMSQADATSFAWSQCDDWSQLSRDLQQSRRHRSDLVRRMQDAADDAVPGSRWRAAFRGLSQDLLFAVRMMRKAPGFTAVAVLTLALGIGANSTIFSVMNATLLKTLPFPEPDRLVLVALTYGTGPDNFNIVSAPNFWDWQRQNQVFDRMAIFDSAGKGYNLGASGSQQEAEQVSGLRITADFFSVLGVRPFLGRGFFPEEETAGKDRVVVLSHGLWMRRFGGDRGIVGRAVRIDGENYTVVGVMPREFQFQFWSEPRELWVPAGWTDGDRSRGSNSFIAIARLKTGVTTAQAQAEISSIQAQLAQHYEEDRKSGAAVVPLAGFGLERVQQITLVLLSAVAFVLLIACVNVANLMLARGAERRKEFAIRRALGASAGRILRQLLAESALLSALGGAAGLALAHGATTLLTGVLPRDFARLPLRPLDAITLEMPVLAFTFLVTCVTGVLFGTAPALAAARGEVRGSLKQGGRGSGQAGTNRLRHVLVASEVGLALVVLAAAGLMIKSLVRLVAVDPGFDPKNVLTMEISVPQANTYYGPPDHARFCEEIEDRVASLAGVQSASAAAHLPLRGNAGRGFIIEGRPTPPPDETPGASYTVTCPAYFRTLGVPILKGREFTRQDSISSPHVVVINEATARRYWPNEDPVGKRLALTTEGPVDWLTVVGVVGNVRHWGLSEDLQPQIFRPYTQAAWPWMYVVVRTATTPAAFTPRLEQAMAVVEPDRPLGSPRTMDDVVRGSVGSRRFPMLMLAAFAGLALVLSAVGIVGVVSYSVTQRMREIGIRVALGAQRRDVVWLMVGGSMSWVLAGVVAGTGVSMAVTRLLVTLLYDVKPADPMVLALVAGVLTTVALAASYVPARRAIRVDPLIALRSE